MSTNIERLTAFMEEKDIQSSSPWTEVIDGVREWLAPSCQKQGEPDWKYWARTNYGPLARTADQWADKWLGYQTTTNGDCHV